MEQTNTPSPIIIQERNSSSIGGKLVTAALLVGGFIYGKKLWADHQANTEAGKLDAPEVQAASKIYNAKHWYGNSNQVAFDAAKGIAEKHIDWKAVSDSFQRQYNDNINNFLDFLGADGKAQFFNILNLTQSDTQKFTGKPPVKSTLKYDVNNYYCFAIANKASNIRKSPEIIGNGGWTSKVGDSNIVAVAEINKVLGLMTGVYKLSKDGKTGFVEFYGQVWGIGGMQLKKLWVAASNIEIKQFSKSTQEEEGRAFMSNSSYLKIDESKYNSANS